MIEDMMRTLQLLREEIPALEETQKAQGKQITTLFEKQDCLAAEVTTTTQDLDKLAMKCTAIHENHDDRLTVLEAQGDRALIQELNEMRGFVYEVRQERIADHKRIARLEALLSARPESS